MYCPSRTRVKVYIQASLVMHASRVRIPLTLRGVFREIFMFIPFESSGFDVNFAQRQSLRPPSLSANHSALLHSAPITPPSFTQRQSLRSHSRSANHSALLHAAPITPPSFTQRQSHRPPSRSANHSALLHSAPITPPSFTQRQ